MSLTMTLLTIYLACALAMAAVWLWALKIKNIGIVDVAWAALMGLSGIFCAVIETGTPVARAAVALMSGLWAWRLFYSLYKRVSHEPEDGRYQALRAAWNGSASKFFKFLNDLSLCHAGSVVRKAGNDIVNALLAKFGRRQLNPRRSTQRRKQFGVGP